MPAPADKLNTHLDLQGVAKLFNLPDAATGDQAIPLRQVLALIATGGGGAVGIDAAQITTGTIAKERLPSPTIII